MNNILQADIFFFISSIATVIITIILGIAGYYVILIVRDAKYITTKLRNATDDLEEKFQEVREQVSEEGRKAKYIVDFFLGRFMGKKKTRSRVQKDEE
jgi:hypothetical protein